MNATSPRLILASSSPRRSSLLQQFGLPFQTAHPRVEERVEPTANPHALVAHNARLKAEAVPALTVPFVSLGADTVVVFEGRILGKPADWNDARRMLSLLNGQAHEVLTGVHLTAPLSGRACAFVESTRVHFHHRSEQEREAYLQRIDPLDKAGAYAAQEDDGWLIASLEGSRTNVIGLPMERLLLELAAFGIFPR